MAGLDRYDATSSHLLHGSAVSLGGKGVLLIGRSGRGKSDLALQMIDRGAVLIADDQVRICREDDRLIAEAPPNLAGLIEIRGIGIMRLPHGKGNLDLVVDLDLNDEEPRLPDPTTVSWYGLSLRKIQINGRSASAVAKINLALHAEPVV
jgi:serine kinase of HPr protein (carbohydrate metabolism regulator)